ncbi:hypothetical protein D6C85_03026 [Aureobasidium pullulans]|uniref:Uncharacterized protein n=1 Tax=Aureobasidium pullulans TaxID=5580 RepID=A0A4S9X914_AURPU|nr:hypothetical protein D6C85_03026 [Aureobasidium pullulans]
MLAGYETSARECVFRSLFKKASDAFDAEDFEESERLCHLLLTYDDLSMYHKAGCHRILSLGNTDFLWHAEQTIKLYKQLFYPDGRPSGEHILSDSQVRIRDDILEHAYRNLVQAERDHVEIRCDYTERSVRFRTIYGCEPTEKDVSRACLNRHSREYLLATEGSVEDYGAFIVRILDRRQEKASGGERK